VTGLIRVPAPGTRRHRKEGIVSGAPVVARTRAELEQARHGLDGSVAVVMTMGALHEGHAALIRRARERADHVVTTIFLNPLQFGPKEDLAKYPRTFDADLELCTKEGVDLVFAPGPDVVYQDGDPGVRLSAGHLGEVLEGHSRPGHFDGVLTVVAKLLHLVTDGAGPGLPVRDRGGPHGARTRRPGPEQPQRLPDGVGSRGRAHPAPGAAGR
jgi:cytidyltransferase-like protein